MSGKRKPVWRRWYVAYPIAVVLAAIIAPIAAMQVHTSSSTTRNLPKPGDRVQAAITALRKDPLYVGPEFADRLTAAQKATITKTLRGAAEPCYLVYWSSGQEGFQIQDDAVREIMAGVGRDGYYAIVDDRQEATLRAQGFGGDYVDADVLKQRIGPALEAYSAEMAQLSGEKDDSQSDYWGGPGGGFAAGLLFAIPSFFALMLLVWIAGVVVRRR